MANFNRVFLIGNLTREPELRYTPQGTAVATLRIAVNTPYKDKNGEAKRDTCFVNVVVWGQAAETCNQYLAKGRAIFVEGRLQSRSWQDAEGKNRSIIEVRATSVQFLGARKEDMRVADLGEEPVGEIKLGSEDLMDVSNDEPKDLGETI
ncbi:MAG: single-stranded DNA-binding protein [Candidatus Omnitrophica bacterium]|nr:single-stranded DNA-binding protein [Candidatus Omnitrophota bacterium]MCM8826190.1 single-stranded DNA-binding protein [Candidatus Omnitrophota bacterium]